MQFNISFEVAGQPPLPPAQQPSLDSLPLYDLILQSARASHLTR